MVGWSTLVMAMLNRTPGMMRASIEHYRYDPTGPSYDFDRVFHLDDANAWLGALFGLLIGLVVSVLWLAPPKPK